MENISEGKMKWIKQLSLLLITLVLLTGSVQIFAASQSTEAKDDEVIKEGIFIIRKPKRKFRIELRNSQMLR